MCDLPEDYLYNILYKLGFVLQDVVTNSPQVDHTLECQLISYCIQKTQIFHKYLEKIDYSEGLSGQDKDLRALFGQIYAIHNNTVTEEPDTDTFNLHILQGGLNIKKGAATKNFIQNHNRTNAGEKCEPIDFKHYFCENNVPGQIDVVQLAREMERLIIDVAIEYKSRLLGLKPFPKEMRALTETITHVIVCVKARISSGKVFSSNKQQLYSIAACLMWITISLDS